MPPGDTLTAVAWILVIGAFVALGIRSNSTNKHIAETKKQEAADAAEKTRLAEEAQRSLIDAADTMLPDWSNAISHLKQRYGWVDMLECTGLNQLHLRLLRQTFDGDRLTLPNLLMLRTDKDARRLMRDAVALAPAPGWPEDVEPMIQEPTVQTLLELAQMGYVSAIPVGIEPTNEYAVSLSDEGRALKTLDARFRDPKDRHPNWPYASPGMELRRSLAKVVRKSTGLAASSAA